MPLSKLGSMETHSDRMPKLTTYKVEKDFKKNSILTVVPPPRVLPESARDEGLNIGLEAISR